MSTIMDVLNELMEEHKAGIARCPQCGKTYLVRGFTGEMNQRQADHFARMCCDPNKQQQSLTLEDKP